jgi:hypothetical protein
MPIVVVGAIAAAGAISVGVAVSTVAMVGLGTTVVGKLTKSKELSQFGAGLGLGAMASSALTGVFGSAAAGSAEAASAAIPNTISSSQLAGIDAAAGGIGGAAGATPGALGGISTGWDAAATAIDSASGATGGLGAAGAGGNSGGLLGSSLNPAAPAQPGVATAATPANPVATASTPVAPPPATDSNSISQWWGRQSEATKNRILQVGGQAVGGLFEGWSAEQRAALERERMKLEQQKYDTAQSNGNAQPVVKFKSYTPATGGLLGATKG